MSSLQFVVTAVFSALAIGAASLLWPKLTSKPSPKPLTEVRRLVVETPVGKEAAAVLGVSQDESTQPVDLRQWAAEQGNAILNNISNSAEQAVVSGVVKQIMGQIDKLPDNQKQELRQSLCVPPTPAPSQQPVQ